MYTIAPLCSPRPPSLFFILVCRVSRDYLRCAYAIGELVSKALVHDWSADVLVEVLIVFLISRRS